VTFGDGVVVEWNPENGSRRKIEHQPPQIASDTGFISGDVQVDEGHTPGDVIATDDSFHFAFTMVKLAYLYLLTSTKVLFKAVLGANWK
jgi:hypothetical protein